MASGKREVASKDEKKKKKAEEQGLLGHGLHQPFATMFTDVFEELPWHLKEQSEQMLAEQRGKFGPDWEPK